MTKHISRRSFLAGTASLTAAGYLSGCSPASTNVNSALPRQLVWSTYGIGTGTYNDLAAIANTLTSEVGVPVRLMTSDTGIGRLAPLINGTADYARAGDEYYYAFEGNDEFASEMWGPQRLRQVWTPPGNYGVLVREDSGIETVGDLEGRRYPRLTASTSMNRKLEAILNYDGLTGDDVVQVDISYAEQVEALRTGQLDALYHNTVGSNIEELASQHPIRWLDLGGDDPSRYDTWEELAPMVRPGEFTEAAGMEPGESAVNMQYTIPLTTLADRPVEEVSTLIDYIDHYYDQFKDVTPDAPNFARDAILLDPMVVPFHDGSVDFLEAVGRWTPDLEARQQALLEREELMADAWPPFLESNSEVEELSLRWVDWKAENLPELPTIEDVPDPGDEPSDDPDENGASS
ncbi:TAXI family TRAP transporter solute-binding subunit [Nesterenkonia salmonea]|uniref:TAXI family TRAP transporter solute-binding subunit n=1 Tax=Nesterenkonia salmonea TaxID=1804987 RepID=A0A5R9BG67_9MICC|nr:TAXI family TRAP transporter solute-binding subunit [Nesterenkonia salmonea]TLP99132.1 TAXI family TRAP transporter solute-binding subunit [Nesterenkonia salmonea]